MPVYLFEHPDTEELFEELRLLSEIDKPFYAPDGELCRRVIGASVGLVNKNAEVWQKDPAYVKQLNPKYVKTRSGHRIRYDPTKHSS